MTAPRWQPVTPSLVREHVPEPDGIDFEVPPAEAAVAARWLQRLRAERAAREEAA